MPKLLGSMLDRENSMRYHQYSSPEAAWNAMGYAIMAGLAVLEEVDNKRCQITRLVTNPDGYLEQRTERINHSVSAIMAYAPEGFKGY